jgi:uracil-DNA glycosylase
VSDSSLSRLAAWAPDAWALAPDWRPHWEAFLGSPAGQGLAQRLRRSLEEGATVYPPQPLRALELTALADTRVVILGQDPYHGPGQAEGLAFSVAAPARRPPSLRNIHAELQRSHGRSPAGPSLVPWAQQGVLLLNTCLTVAEGQPASHARWGWEACTDALIRACAQQGPPKVFLLWGAYAQSKRGLIEGSRHLVLQANHPSPLSARRPPLPFIGCDHFALADRWMAARGEKNIDWFADPEKTVA